MNEMNWLTEIMTRQTIAVLIEKQKTGCFGQVTRKSVYVWKVIKKDDTEILMSKKIKRRH